MGCPLMGIKSLTTCLPVMYGPLGGGGGIDTKSIYH